MTMMLMQYTQKILKPYTEGGNYWAQWSDFVGLFTMVHRFAQAHG